MLRGSSRYRFISAAVSRRPRQQTRRAPLLLSIKDLRQRQTDGQTYVQTLGGSITFMIYYVDRVIIRDAFGNVNG